MQWLCNISIQDAQCQLSECGRNGVELGSQYGAIAESLQKKGLYSPS